jgi:hypothetical protein
LTVANKLVTARRALNENLGREEVGCGDECGLKTLKSYIGMNSVATREEAMRLPIARKGTGANCVMFSALI